MEEAEKRQITDMESCRGIRASSSRRIATSGGGCGILARKGPWLLSFVALRLLIVLEASSVRNRSCRLAEPVSDYSLNGKWSYAAFTVVLDASVGGLQLQNVITACCAPGCGSKFRSLKVTLQFTITVYAQSSGSTLMFP